MKKKDYENQNSKFLSTKCYEVWFSSTEHIENQHHRIIKAKGVRFEVETKLEEELKEETKQEAENLVKDEKVVDEDDESFNSQKFLDCTFVSGSNFLVTWLNLRSKLEEWLWFKTNLFLIPYTENWTQELSQDQEEEEEEEEDDEEDEEAKPAVEEESDEDNSQTLFDSMSEPDSE